MNIVIKQEQVKDYKITEEVVKNGKTHKVGVFLYTEKLVRNLEN